MYYHLLHNTLTASAFEALLDIPSSAGHRLEIVSFLHPTECAIVNRRTREGLAALSCGADFPSRLTMDEDYVAYPNFIADVLDRSGRGR